MTKHTVDYDDIKAAETRIKGKVNVTPVLECSTINDMCPFPAKIYFKAEIFQKVGAFKARGATNAVLMLNEQNARNGVVTHSSGNHAQALAFAARSRGIPCYVVMPSTSPQVKKNAVRDYGAKIIECEPTLLARETTADEVIKRTNATFIHPYNNLNIIAGQGTLALEFLDQVSNLDCMVIPVGGGGLLSGTCIAAKSRNPNIRIFAAEPAKVDDCFRSFKSKKLLLGADNARSVADGLLTSLGDYTWPIIQSLVEDVFIVTEQQIIDAMRLIWERMKLIVEPSAAVAVAVLLYNAEFAKLKGIKSIGIVLEGGNVDLAKLPWQIQSNARL